MLDRLYLGSVIDENNEYYKAVMKEDKFEKVKDSSVSLTSVDDYFYLQKDIFYLTTGPVMKFIDDPENPTMLNRVASTPSGLTSAFAVDGLGNVYTGDKIQTEYILKFDSDTLSQTLRSPEMVESHVRSMAFVDGFLFVGQNTRLSKYDPDTLEVVSEISSGLTYVRDIIDDGNGNLIIVDDNQLKKFNSDTLELLATGTESFAGISKLILREGDVVAQQGSSIRLFDRVTLENIKTFQGNLSGDIGVDSRGYIYATHNKTLTVIDNIGRVILRYTSETTNSLITHLLVNPFKSGIFIARYFNTDETTSKEYRHLNRIIGYTKGDN